MFLVGTKIVFYKWGAVATPIYQYGMFCEKFYMSDTQKVFQLYIDDKIISYKNYNQHDMDIVQEVIQNYINQKKSNPEIYTTLNRFYSKIGITSFINKKNYLNTISDEAFINWFAKNIPKNRCQNPKDLKVELHEFLYKQTHLVFLKSTTIIDSLAFVR